MEINNAYDAFWFLTDHPKAVIGKVDPDLKHVDDAAFIDNIVLIYVKINPETNSITDTDADTQVQVWLESGPQEWNDALQDYIPTHDPDLDCGGDTFDDALIALANKVKEHYGDYESERM